MWNEYTIEKYLYTFNKCAYVVIIISIRNKKNHNKK